MGTFLRSVAKAVGAIDAVDLVLVPGLSALETDVDHEHAMAFVEIEGGDHGIGIGLGIEGLGSEPFVMIERLDQANIHELSSGSGFVFGARVGLLPRFAGLGTDVERFRIVLRPRKNRW